MSLPYRSFNGVSPILVSSVGPTELNASGVPTDALSKYFFLLSPSDAFTTDLPIEISGTADKTLPLLSNVPIPLPSASTKTIAYL